MLWYNVAWSARNVDDRMKNVCCCINNTLRPRQNGRHLSDDVFTCIFLNDSAWISIKISLTFCLNRPINNIPALVQIMAWHRPGEKPLYEPMMVNLLTHICVTRPHWVNDPSRSYVYLYHGLSNMFYETKLETFYRILSSRTLMCDLTSITRRTRISCLPTVKPLI